MPVKPVPQYYTRSGGESSLLFINHSIDVSIYYKCIMSKRLRVVQRIRFLQIPTKKIAEY